MVHALALPTGWIVLFAVVLGLVVGSFINVVIVRLPGMLEAEWRYAAADILEQDAPDADPPPTLVKPGSHCPSCGTRVRAIDNIPVVSFLLLGGRCRSCRTPIGLLYPAIELAGGLIALIALARFGPTPMAGATAGLGWVLLAAAGIDARTRLLPDALTFLALWAGLVASLGAAIPLTRVGPADAIMGAAGGYLFFWGVYQLFRLATGKHGMGHGDFKLAAALGAWIGWQLLPVMILLATVLGLLASLVLMAIGRLGPARMLAFGPWLALGGWLTLLFGPQMIAWYASAAGLH